MREALSLIGRELKAESEQRAGRKILTSFPLSLFVVKDQRLR